MLPTAPSLIQRLLVVLASVLLALACWAAIVYPRQLPVKWDGPLKSASFAPFRDGQSPLREIFPTPAQIEEDLVLLKGIFEGVRTYTATDGMEILPPLAAKHGFTLTHSAWLGRDPVRNDEEVSVLIDTANRYPQAIKRVIVGNEVLLRQDLEPEELITYIDSVRAAVPQPVSYADVWAFWLKHPQVADHVDYLTIHILPYWEDEPVSLEEAQQHMLAIIDRIKVRFPGKPILVGETGWPTEGRSRGPAHANLLTAAHFARDLPRLAAEHDFDYNLVEAYDQSWKAQLEGTVGARWGMFDAHRRLKYALTGPVLPVDNAIPRMMISVVLGMVLAAFLVVRLSTVRQLLLTGIWSQLFAAALVQSVYKAIRLTDAPASFTWLQQHVLFFMADQHWLSDESVAFWYKLLLQQWAEPMALGWGWILALFATGFAIASLLWIRALLEDRKPGRIAMLARSGFGAYGIAALVFAAMFSTSGRYMDIPLDHILLPLSVALALWCLSRKDGTGDCRVFTRCEGFNRYAIWILPMAALACIWGEVRAMQGGQDFIAMHPTLAEQIPLIAGSILANHELLAWCTACVLLALVFDRRHAAVRSA